MPQIDKFSFVPILFWFFIIFLSFYFVYFYFYLLPTTNFFKLRFKKIKFVFLKTNVLFQTYKKYNQRKFLRLFDVN